MRVAILLAAGRSRRYAAGNKLLARWRGRSLVAWSADAALKAPVGRVILVVGHDHARVAAAARGPRMLTVRARDHRQGMAASLRAGFVRLRPVEREVFVFLADMPVVPAHVTRRLARGLSSGVLAVRPAGGREPGHPVLMRRPSANEIRGLRGDRGLGALIAGRTRLIPFAGRAQADVDTRRDLARRR